MRYFFILLIISLGTSCWAYDQSCEYDLQGLTVQQAEGIALDDNYNIQSFLFQVDRSYYDKLVTVGAWLPQIAGNAQSVRTVIGPTLGYGTFNYSTVNFFQNVFNTDEYFNVKLADVNFKLTKANLLQVTTDVLFNVRVGYFRIIAFQKLVDVRRDNANLLKELLQRERARFEAGEGTLYLANQSEAAYENALSELYDAERQLQVAIHDFLAFMGLPPTTHFSLAEHDIPLDKIPPLREKVTKIEQGVPSSIIFSREESAFWEDMALAYNPEVEIRRLQYRLDVVDRYRNIGHYAPTVNLFANFHNNGGRNLPPKSYWDMGVNVDWVFFNGFSRENSIKASTKLVYSAEMDFNQAVLVSQVTIHDRIADANAALQSYRSSKRAVEVAVEAVEIAKTQETVGEVTFLEYLQSVQALLVARQNLIQAKFDLISAYFAILRVTGADVMMLRQGLVHTGGFAYFGDYCSYFDLLKSNEDIVCHD